MAPSPVPVLIIVLLTMFFQGVMFGDELAAQLFPQPDSVDDACDGDGFFAGMKCFVAKVVFFFKVIGAGIAFFFSLLIFNVPGAPLWVQVPVGTLLSVATGWSLITLFRGN